MSICQEAREQIRYASPEYKPNRMTQNKHHNWKNQLSRKQIDKCRIFYDCSSNVEQQNSMWYWFPLCSKHVQQKPISHLTTRASKAAFIQGASNVNKTLFTKPFKQKRGKRSVFKRTLREINPLWTDIQIYFVKAPLVKHNTASA